MVLITKASFKGNPPEERKQFVDASCLMPMSVGQAVHEGEKLIAVLKLVNVSFKTCTILVDDSIQRYTLAIEQAIEPDMAYHEALMLGEAWLIRNRPFFSALTIPYEVLRWDDWLRHPEFEKNLERVTRCYHDDAVYKAAIHHNVDVFLTRYLDRYPERVASRRRAEQLCVDYLLEECAVMCLWTVGEYDFELYPSGRNPAMTATYDLLIKPHFPTYLRSVGIRFKKYPVQSLETVP